MHKNTLYLVILCVLTRATCLEANKKKTMQQELLDLLKYIVRNKNDQVARTDPDERASFTDLTRSDGYVAARKNNYKNKILVKRIIPHKIGEIDEGYKRHYRPLFKIHNVPVVNDVLQNIINSRTTNDSPAEPRLGSREDADGVRVFKILGGKSHIKPKVGYGDSKDDVLRHWTEADMAEALEGLQVVPGNRPVDDQLLPWNPNYPDWNYWTYYKTIYQDSCPGQQIKVGNVCVRTPGH